MTLNITHLLRKIQSKKVLLRQALFIVKAGKNTWPINPYCIKLQCNTCTKTRFT